MFRNLLSTPVRGAHVARFHREGGDLCEAVAQFILDGMHRGERSVLVATSAHWAEVRRLLAISGYDVDHEYAAHVVYADADAVLRDITVRGSVDTVRFEAALAAVLSRVASPFRVFGELVTLLAARGELDAALEIERIGDRLARSTGAEVWCGYDVQHLGLYSDGVDRVAAAHDSAVPERPAGARDGKVLLLVDDFEDSLHLYAEFFKANGYRVVTAEDGNQAVKLARIWFPDVVLMDIRMPGLSGVDAMRLLKAEAPFARVPIAAFTANAYDSARKEFLAQGSAVITKPCLPESLLAQVSALCAANA